MHILVLDTGTSSMRGVLFSHTGRELFCRQAPYRPAYLENGWAEQDPAQWEAALYAVLSDAAAFSREKGLPIDGVALTSQRSSVIPVGRDMRPLCPAIMWQDKRVEPLCREWEPESGWVRGRCGAGLNPVFSGPKMAWLHRERPDIYEKAYKLLVVPDYLLYLLTGELCTDYTYGSRSLLMDLREKRWDPELLELFGVEEGKLCPLVEPGAICGHTTRGLEACTGFPQGVPVITAGGDQQCGAIGQGVVRPGVLSATAGTGGYLAAGAGGVPADLGPEVVCNCAAIPGQYILEYSVLTCSAAFDWFLREFCGPGAAPADLDREVEQSPPGANGCLCLPYFQGRGTPDWNTRATASFHGVTLHTRRQDMLRALLEGLCLELARGVEAMGRYVPIRQVYTNGGLANSRPFCQMQSDAYGLEVIRLGKADATARGALLAAAVSLGAYGSFEEAFQQAGRGGQALIYTPQPDTAAFYKELRARQGALYSALWPNAGEKEGDARVQHP